MPHLKALVEVVSSFTVEAACPLRVLEPPAPCFPADIAVSIPTAIVLPAELPPLLDSYSFHIILYFSPDRPLFPGLEPESTEAVSDDLDLIFLERP